MDTTGGRGAGVKSGQRPRGGGSWHAQSEWSVKEDKPWEAQGTSQTSEMTVRFGPVPSDFESRVKLPVRRSMRHKPRHPPRDDLIGF